MQRYVVLWGIMQCFDSAYLRLWNIECLKDIIVIYMHDLRKVLTMAADLH